MDWISAGLGAAVPAAGFAGKLIYRWMKGEQYGAARKIARESDVLAKERESALEERIRQMLRAELAVMETRIFERINGKYLQTNLAEAKFGELTRRTEKLESGHQELYQYTHNRSHDLANEVMRLRVVKGQ